MLTYFFCHHEKSQIIWVVLHIRHIPKPLKLINLPERFYNLTYSCWVIRVDYTVRNNLIDSNSCLCPSMWVMLYIMNISSTTRDIGEYSRLNEAVKYCLSTFGLLQLLKNYVIIFHTYIVKALLRPEKVYITTKCHDWSTASHNTAYLVNLLIFYSMKVLRV